MEVNEVEDVLDSLDPSKIREILIFKMRIYSRVNRGLITHFMLPLRTQEWKQVFEDLLEEGVVKVKGLPLMSPSGQTRTYEVFYLADESQVFSLDQGGQATT